MSILSYILNHAYNWSIKIMYFVVIDTLFRFLVLPYITNMQVLMWYILNLGFYQIMPEESVLLILNMVGFSLSIIMLFHIFGEHHAPAHSHKSSPAQ